MIDRFIKKAIIYNYSYHFKVNTINLQLFHQLLHTWSITGSITDTIASTITEIFSSTGTSTIAYSTDAVLKEVLTKTIQNQIIMLLYYVHRWMIDSLIRKLNI